MVGVRVAVAGTAVGARVGTMVGAGVLFSGVTRIVTSGWVRSEARELQRSTAAA